MFGYKLRWVSDNLAIGVAPGSSASLETVRNEGIDVILNLCAECGNLHIVERDTGFHVYWLPVRDAFAPEIEEVDAALEWLDQYLSNGKKALVHCRFGAGRSSTIIAAYLLKKGLGLGDVLERMKIAKAAPTSREQLKFLSEYAEKMGVKTTQASFDLNQVGKKGRLLYYFNVVRSWIKPL